MEIVFQQCFSFQCEYLICLAVLVYNREPIYDPENLRSFFKKQNYFTINSNNCIYPKRFLTMMPSRQVDIRMIFENKLAYLGLAIAVSLARKNSLPLWGIFHCKNMS